MEFRILGELEIAGRDRVLPLPRGKVRILLADLLIQANRSVPVDALLDHLWGEVLPPTAKTALQGLISQIRRLLADGGDEASVKTTAGGYLLQIGAHSLDSDRFSHAAAAAKEILRSDPASAHEILAGALSLWRGPALADVAYEGFAQPTIARLEELRVDALEDGFEAALAVGGHSKVVGPLAAHQVEHPYRERPCGQLMLALYRSGRHTDALEAHQAIRRALMEDLGLEPGAGLNALQQAILRHDPRLDLPGCTAELLHQPEDLLPRPAPPQSVSPIRHAARLPIKTQPLIGRERQLSELASLVREGARLITLTGPGGAGKTRLAVELGATSMSSFADAVYFCDLAPVPDHDLVPAVVGGALGLRDRAQPDLEQSLVESLGSRRLMLIVDNLEHILEAGVFLARLVSACPELTVIATSRAPLRVDPEVEWMVPPLATDAGVALLIERAARTGGNDAISELQRDTLAEQIVGCLGGLPLAIELAAARLRVLEPRDLLARLERPLSVLISGARDAPARQRTLRATLDWSHDLLELGQQVALARCAVFPSAFTPRAAELLGVRIDALEALVEHSLLTRDGGRLEMLAAVREYGLERLKESDEDAAIRGRHADIFVSLVAGLGLAFYRADQTVALEEASAVLDDIRAALDWLLSCNRHGDALELASNLWVLWETRHRVEGRRWLTRALEGSDGVDERTRAAGLLAAGNLALFQGDADVARPLLEEAEQIFATIRDDERRAMALGRLGWCPPRRADREASVEMRDELEALLERIEAPAVRADVLSLVGGVLLENGEPARAFEHFRESRDTWATVGSQVQVAHLLNNLGWTAMLLGDLRDARRFLVESLELGSVVEPQLFKMLATGSLAVVCGLEGNTLEAAVLIVDNLQASREQGDVRSGTEALVVAGAVLAAQRPEDAARLLAAADALDRPQEGLQQLIDSVVAPAVGTLDRETLESAREAGSRLGFAGAVEEALRLLQPIVAGTAQGMEPSRP